MSERRLSSRAVKIGAVGAISVALATWGFVACSPGDDATADCVTGPDANGEYTIVDDDECDDGSYSSTGHSSFWYYNAHHRTGNRISGGTTLKPKSGGIKTSSGTTIRKGGFGSHGGSGGS